MALDLRTAQTSLENTLRDVIVQALGRRLPAVTSVAALRTVVTRGAATSQRNDDDLINVVVSGVVTAAYRWNQASTAADDGVNVIQPDDVSGNGRWLLWTSPVVLAATPDSDSMYLHQLQYGPVERVLVIDRRFDKEEIAALLVGAVPAVVIEASGDEPVDYKEMTGHLYDVAYDFTITVIAENLRSQREAAQASYPTPALSDPSPGANAIDGILMALLGGININPAESGIRNVKLGRGDNFSSELGQRRVMRERQYRILATVENPQAPNDVGVAQEMTLQANLAQLNENHDPFDPMNYVESGLWVVVGSGLEQLVAAGSAQMAGSPVDYAGEYYTFPATSDTYRDLGPDGSMTFVSVPAGTYPPPVTDSTMRIGMTTTDDTDVVSDVILASSYEAYGSQYQVSLED